MASAELCFVELSLCVSCDVVAIQRAQFEIKMEDKGARNCREIFQNADLLKLVDGQYLYN